MNKNIGIIMIAVMFGIYTVGVWLTAVNVNRCDNRGQASDVSTIR